MTDVHALLTAVSDQVLGDEDPATVIDRFHTPDIEHWYDGVHLERTAMIDHARQMRESVLSSRYDFHETVTDGSHAAVRCTLTATMRQGATLTTEIHLFATFSPDGRFRRLHQLTRPISTDTAQERRPS